MGTSMYGIQKQYITKNKWHLLYNDSTDCANLVVFFSDTSFFDDVILPKHTRKYVPEYYSPYINSFYSYRDDSMPMRGMNHIC